MQFRHEESLAERRRGQGSRRESDRVHEQPQRMQAGGVGQAMQRHDAQQCASRRRPRLLSSRAVCCHMPRSGESDEEGCEGDMSWISTGVDGAQDEVDGDEGRFAHGP